MWRRVEAGRLHRLLEAEPMLVRVCQSGPLPASVLVCSTRSDQDLTLPAWLAGPTTPSFSIRSMIDAARL